MATKIVSKFSLVRAISAFLNLGEAGKLDSFFTRVIKTLSKEVTAHKKNLENLKFNHEQKLDELNDSLEDANAALDEAYLKVDMDQLANNASQQSFQDIYLENIDNHELAVQKIEKKIQEEKDSYAEKVKSVQENINSLEKRIAKISAE